MLKNLKQLVPRAIFSTFPRPFSQARIRNFFEVDPVLPDFHDPDRHLDIKRFPIHEELEKSWKHKQAHWDLALTEAKKNLKERKRVKRETQDKESRIRTLDDVARAIAGHVVVDPDFNLPYGYGFDDFIAGLKEKNLSSSSEVFLNGLNKLFTSLKYQSDLQLVEYHREAIVKATNGDYKEKARAILLKHVIKEIKNQRVVKESGETGGRKILRKIIPDQDFLDQTIEKGGELNAETIKKIQKQIDPKMLQNAAENLADQALTERIQVNKEIRRKSNLVAKPGEYILEEELQRLHEMQGQNERSGIDDVDAIVPYELPLHTFRMSDVEFSNHQVTSEIQRKYNTKKLQLITGILEEQMENEKDDPDEVEEAKDDEESIQKKLEEAQGIPEVMEDEDEDRTSRNEKKQETAEDIFKRKFVGDTEVEELERQVGVVGRPPSFKEVFDSIDRILEYAPVSIQNNVTADAHTGNTTFKPKYTGLVVNPDQFFWGNLSHLLEPVLPTYVNRENSIARDVIESSGYTLKRPAQNEVSIFSKDYVPPPKPDLYDDNATLNVNELTPSLEKEIELFRYVRKDPYFRHTLINELRYYADRKNDAFAMLANGISSGMSRGEAFKEFELPDMSKAPSFIQKEIKLEATKYHGKAFGCGRRKKCNALAVIQEGTGIIKINRKTFLNYFGEASHRSLVIEPLLVSAYSISLDVNLYIWGGGMHAQAESGSLAIARALVNWNPQVKKSLKENGLLFRDVRKVERKHVGKYKARKKFPYARR